MTKNTQACPKCHGSGETVLQRHYVAQFSRTTICGVCLGTGEVDSTVADQWQSSQKKSKLKDTILQKVEKVLGAVL